MKVEPLTESLSWRGKLYPRGSTQIPDELAIALNLPISQPEEVKEEEAIAPTPPEPTEAQQELDKLGIAPPEAIEEKPSSKRRRGREG